jgi:phosphatidylinositol alpha-1,6-mannosyltransferase
MGGMEAVMYSLSKHFASKGFDTVVAADKPFYEKTEFRFKSFNAPRFARAIYKKLALSIAERAADLAICDSWKSVSAVPNSAKKVIVLAHGQEFLDTGKKSNRIRKALQRSDLVVASSKMTADLVTQVAPDSSVKVVYPTYMLNTPMNFEHTENPVLEILTLCRIDERKGIIQSLHALEIAAKNGVNFRWKIAGSGPLLEKLKDELEQSQIKENVVLLGRVDDKLKGKLLSNSDLFLMPSYQVGKSLEGFGISYIEAASYGIPAIAGDVGGAPEAVINQQTGWCVDGRNSEEIAEAISEAYNNPTLRKAMGFNAHKRFTDELEGNKVFDQLLALIDSL